MGTNVQAYHCDGLDYHRFAVTLMGRTLQSVHTFRMGSLLIDTGPGRCRREVVASLDGRTPEVILLTHFHEDHTGNAGHLQSRFGAKLYAHPDGAAMLRRGIRVNPIGRLITGNIQKATAQPLEDGQFVEHDGYRLQAIHTPGHTNDHLAFYEENKGWLFPGDLYVADRIKYFEASESLALQIESIRKLVALDFDSLFCSHNPKVKAGKERLQRKLQLFEDFYGSVAEMHRQGMSEIEIFKTTGREEHHFYKAVTFGHYCALNMVKSVLRDESQKT